MFLALVSRLLLGVRSPLGGAVRRVGGASIIAAISVGRIAIASHQEIANFLAQVERRAY